MTEMAVVGKRMPRQDAWGKVSGETRYVDDLHFPGMLHGALVRSPYPHARIVRIDTSAALALPGVKAVLTAADLPPIRTGYRNDNAPLHGDKVRCAGDAVAAVAAVDRDTALEAAELVQVEYEPLPAVFDPETALKPDAPLVHAEDWVDHLGKDRRPRRDNLSLHFHWQHGDPDAAWAQCDVIVEGRFTVPLVHPAPIELSACIAVWDVQGNLTMYSPTQAPHLYQREMADALGISGQRVRVVGTPIGGGFGKNLEAHVWDIACAHLARVTGRPVKLAFNRVEEFMVGRPRQPHVMYVKAGATRDGKLVARTCEAYLDNGAYNSWGCLTPMVTMQAFSSFYRVPNVRYDAYIVYTNNPWSGSMRGYGNPEGVFVVEQTMDMLAEKLGMDPLAFRRLNANQPGEVTPQKMKLATCAIEDCLQAAAERLDFSARYRAAGPGPDGKLRGVGLAGVLHVAGGARIYKSDGCGMMIKIDDFGKVSVLAGHSDMGQGSDQVVIQVVAETLGVGEGDVRIIARDTAVVPWDVGVHASRTTFIAGNAALRAALDCKRQLLAAAAEQLGVAADDLDCRERYVYLKADPARRIAYDKVVRALHFKQQGNLIMGHGFYDPPTEMMAADWSGNVSAAYHFGAHAVEVAVDPVTGAVEVLQIVAAHDVGRAINPQAIEGQVHGGAVMGLGYALSEEMKLQDGTIVNASMREYGLLTADRVPPVTPVILEQPDPEGPLGARGGLGEATLVPVAAAVANAVANATGVRITTLPITPEKVLNALRARGGDAAGGAAAARAGARAPQPVAGGSNGEAAEEGEA